MSVSFSNPAVEFADLPELDDDLFVAVERSYFWMRLILLLGFFTVLVSLVIALAVADIGLTRTQLSGLGLIPIIGLAVTVPCQWLEVARMGYMLREHDFSFRSGVIRTTVATIPFSRVQNVAIDRGALARIFGLSNLRLHSAGGTIHVVGVTYSSAERLKSFIVDQARIAADQELAAR